MSDGTGPYEVHKIEQLPDGVFESRKGTALALHTACDKWLCDQRPVSTDWADVTCKKCKRRRDGGE